ncbi:MAG: hypothetical protein FJ276_35315, partial [Planctomycetes bacterium]|nr:hypothetical protein [Planctomycetota bacterium]
MPEHRRVSDVALRFRAPTPTHAPYRSAGCPRGYFCFTDMMATLADVIDAELPDDAGPDSFSFLPVLLGTQPEDRPVR